MTKSSLNKTHTKRAQEALRTGRLSRRELISRANKKFGPREASIVIKAILSGENSK